MSGRSAITSGRLASGEYAANFSDVKPPLTPDAALVEASRCYFCFDAPCVEACPTGIDIPQFIRKISTGNVRGAAVEILSENIFGGACARVCPTEILCERDCVRMDQEKTPVQIGRLQRRATDFLMEEGVQPFDRAAPTAKKIAIVGGGPGGLSCAHALARNGHETVVFEAREKGGGLNEYGIAGYKVPDDFAQRELAFILGIGGIDLRTGIALGRDVSLADLEKEFDAVFLSIGLGGARGLEVEGGSLDGVVPAIEYIAELRQAADLSALPVAQNVVVIGGGNTAIDIAVQSKRLGADLVTIVYRRGPGEMGATWHEQEFAQTNGVSIRHWMTPHKVLGTNGTVSGIEVERTQIDADGKLQGTGEIETLDTDIVFTAMGQFLTEDDFSAGENGAAVELQGGRVVVDETMQTTVPGVFAGGDCIAGGLDLTVQSVQDGKIAATHIDAYLRRKS
jgi:glutamate synthase (NADPH/NADH) small chain